MPTGHLSLRERPPCGRPARAVLAGVSGSPWGDHPSFAACGEGPSLCSCAWRPNRCPLDITLSNPKARSHPHHRHQIKKPPRGGFFIWWRRRESNPRPQALHRRYYML